MNTGKLTIGNQERAFSKDVSTAIEEHLDWIKQCFVAKHGGWGQNITKMVITESRIEGGGKTYDVYTKAEGVKPKLAVMRLRIDAQHANHIPSNIPAYQFDGDIVHRSMDVAITADEDKVLPKGYKLSITG